jgi:phosphatidylglycerophosphatase A
MKNAFGVVLDDVVAGIYAGLVLRLILYFIP